MENAERSIDRFSCRFTTVRDVQGEHIKSPSYDFKPLPPEERRPAIRSEYDIIVDGDEFNKEIREQRADRLVVQRSTWNGKQFRSYRVGADTFNTKPQPFVFDAKVWDPRTFAFDATPVESRIKILRSFFSRGELSIRTGQLDGRETIIVEGIGQEQLQRGYRMWISPAHNHLPVRIEAYRGNGLAHRFVEIEHREVKPGVWFPVAGYMEYMGRLTSKPGQITTRVRMEVDTKSINLSPPISPEIFFLPVPEGMKVIDGAEIGMRRERNRESMASAAALALEDARRLAQVIPSNRQHESSVDDSQNSVKAAWPSLLLLVGLGFVSVRLIGRRPAKSQGL
jgi:hypothetical protein